MLLTGVTVLFSYMGTENVATVAAEATDPHKAIARAIRSVVTRIVVFYVGSTIIVITIIPSSSESLTGGAYPAVFNALQMPVLAAAIQIVVATSILSLANSSLYTTSRLLYAAAVRQEMPPRLAVVSRSGAPRWAAGAIAIAAGLCLLLNFLLPAADVISLLISVTGAGGVLTYSVISLTYLRSPARTPKQEVDGLGRSYDPRGGRAGPGLGPRQPPATDPDDRRRRSLCALWGRDPAANQKPGCTYADGESRPRVGRFSPQGDRLIRQEQGRRFS